MTTQLHTKIAELEAAHDAEISAGRRNAAGAIHQEIHRLRRERDAQAAIGSIALMSDGAALTQLAELYSGWSAWLSARADEAEAAEALAAARARAQELAPRDPDAVQRLQRDGIAVLPLGELAQSPLGVERLRAGAKLYHALALAVRRALGES